METIKLFHFYGLKTSLLVCDGASPNLTTIKVTHGHFGAYSFKKGTFFMYYSNYVLLFTFMYHAFSFIKMRLTMIDMKSCHP